MDPITCPACYAIAAGIVESKLKRYRVHVKALNDACQKATKRSTSIDNDISRVFDQ